MAAFQNLHKSFKICMRGHGGVQTPQTGGSNQSVSLCTLRHQHVPASGGHTGFIFYSFYEIFDHSSIPFQMQCSVLPKDQQFLHFRRGTSSNRCEDHYGTSKWGRLTTLELTASSNDVTNLFAQKAAQHAIDRVAFLIGDPVKYFLHFIWIIDLHLKQSNDLCYVCLQSGMVHF